LSESKSTSESGLHSQSAEERFGKKARAGEVLSPPPVDLLQVFKNSVCADSLVIEDEETSPSRI